MDGAQTGDGEDTDNDGRVHGHVNQDSVAVTNAFVAEHGGEDLDIVEELFVGDGLSGFCHGAVVVDGD